MKYIRKWICYLLVLSLVAGFSAVPAWAEETNPEDPLAVKNYEAFGAPMETEPKETEPGETEPAGEEIPEETLPAVETPEEDPVTEQPEASVPEETEPEQPVDEIVVDEIVIDVTDEEETEVVEEPIPEETEPEAIAAQEEYEGSTLKGMPLYDQNDYPGVLYGTGTLAKNGCSITALAMVATYMTGYEYYPNDLARYFGGQANNSIDRLELASDALGLTFRKAENWHKAREALWAGKIVILMVGSNSPFTESQHFMVLTGVTEDGKILVNDPNGKNYDRWDLAEGFENGFPEWAIVQGYSGAWVYDKDAMPETVPFYYEPELDRSNSRYPNVQLSREDRELIARVVWVEARGESPDGQQAVAEVILNRLSAENRFPHTLYDVIYGEGQFRSVDFLEDAEPGQVQYEAIDRALYGPNILPKDVYYFATYAATPRVWGTIGGHIFCY